MAKNDNRPSDQLHLSIELADNGIIMRDRDCADIVEVEKYDNTFDYSDKPRYNADIHRMLGRKIYEWIMEVVVDDNVRDWATNGADIDINVRLNGHKK